MIFRKRENGKTVKQQLGYHIDDTQTTVNCENDNLDVVTVRKTENVARDNGHYLSICIYISYNSFIYIYINTYVYIHDYVHGLLRSNVCHFRLLGSLLLKDSSC